MTGELHRPRDLGEITRTGPAQTQGTFSFDEATMRSLINEWKDLAESYDASTRPARDMMLVEGPGDEYASEALARSANLSGEAYLAYLEHNRDYCWRQAQLFQNALDDYLGVEHTNVVEIDKSGRDGQQGGV
jgi:hypothetical protein